MKKLRLPTIELAFVLIAAFTIFTATFYQMSTAGILPGNDPAVHLGKSEEIVIDQRVTYSAVPWYPPLFHTILAILQILAGTLDVIASAFLLKIMMATLNVLILLSTFLLCRRIFGKGFAVAASVFTVLSVPFSEIIFWGGYANFLGLAYIVFFFYIMNKEMNIYLKTFMLFFGSFTIVLTHQLATFVFVFLFIPAFLTTRMGGTKRKFLAFFGIIIGGGLALLAWYARLIIEYSNMIIEHLFFAMEETFYNIPEVELTALTRNNFGASLFIALAGIPVTVVLLKKERKLEATILIFSWIAIPFLLSQSYFFGLYLPYIRFVYFFVTPIAILSGVLVYSLTKIPNLIGNSITTRFKGKQIVVYLSKILVLAVIVSLFSLQLSFFIQRTETYTQFYQRAPVSSYNSGLWIKQYSTSDGRIVTPRSPGSWMYVFSDYLTMAETDPQYDRNTVAESILYSFYELENSYTLTREYISDSDGGQELYVLFHNIWKKGITIPNEQATLIYVTPFGEWVTIPLSETSEKVYWKKITIDEAQLATEYNHELFTIEKTLIFSSNSSVVNINWTIETYKDLSNVKLSVANFMFAGFNFKEALVPGVLNWQNPWDNPDAYINEKGLWSVVEGPYDLVNGSEIAILDSQNEILAIFEFDDNPEWFTIGALEDHFIDALRLRYELDHLGEGDEKQISYSILLCTPDIEQVKQLNASDLQQHFDSSTKLNIHATDYVTNIKEYNIKFVVVDTEQILSDRKPSPDLDRIHDSDRITVYTTKR